MDWGERCTRDGARARVRRRMASDDSRREAQARSRDVEGKGASAGTHQSRNRGTARSQARRSGGGKSADRGGTRRRRDLLHLRFGPLSERKRIRARRRNLHVEGRVISLILWFVILNDSRQRVCDFFGKSSRLRSIRDSQTYWTLTLYGDTLMTQLSAMHRV